MNRLAPAPGEFSRADTLAVVRDRALEYRETPFAIASGFSHHYIDVKRGFSDGPTLRRMARLVTRVALEELNVDFNAVGGPHMGADFIAHAVAIEREDTDCGWFSVIGNDTDLNEWDKRAYAGHSVIGAELDENSEVLWVEDNTSTGESSRQRIELFRRDPRARRARIVGAVAIVDRGEGATRMFRGLGIPFASLVTYRDLGIPPVVT